MIAKCAAEVSYSNTCKVCCLKKEGDDKFCHFQGPNQMNWSFITAEENSVKVMQNR